MKAVELSKPMNIKALFRDFGQSLNSWVNIKIGYDEKIYILLSEHIPERINGMFVNIEDMEINLSQFLYWCLHGDTETFYTDYRWENWKEDLTDLDYNEGIAFYPFLWAKAENLENRERRRIPYRQDNACAKTSRKV